MKQLFFFIAFCFSMTVNAQKADYRIIPLPQHVETDSTKSFSLKDGTEIAFDKNNKEIARTAQFLKTYVEELTGLTLRLAPDNRNAQIQLILLSELPIDTPEGIFKGKYTMSVNKNGIYLLAPTPEGLFRAVQTLRKSLPVTQTQSIEFPYTTISDRPRFQYRGVHLDSSRHFWTVETVKTYLDMLALHGCNQFHWHLTDDQGWRFEVKALPELAKKGSIREQTVIGRNSGVFDGTPYGGYYTQEECREIVRYAAERYINIIPEIDLPGHMQAALHVYPNLGCTGGPYPVWQVWGVSEDVLCAGNPETMTFLKTVLRELCDVFPSKLIHIGGDECPKIRWKACPKCQAKAKELGITDDGRHSVENQLQTAINKEIEAYLASLGRDIIGWDETLEGGLTERATVMSWRGTRGGIEAARLHHNVIMTPVDYCYIDYYQVKNNWNAPLAIGGYVPASKTYSFEPVPDELSDDEKHFILGPQVNLWCEYIAHTPHLFYMLLPRLDAISEVQWTNPELKDFDDFKSRLQHQFDIYNLLNINYCKTVE